MIYTLLKPGKRVTWKAVNSTPSGTVVRVDERGAHIAVDGGGFMILTTKDALDAAREARERRKKQANNRNSNL